ncbi:hypothetical protein QR680_005186 [Steinernema hermaphroditum]|uniref:ShKT domain-containing protein n=1 Tax=Steinernema hermaphroditum TaxID=289476 RepID=A0AA39HTG1_9BILA|nr:hypothetical protein QR680_005186 [Steinernema hermaphroditum]
MRSRFVTHVLGGVLFLSTLLVAQNLLGPCFGDRCPEGWQCINSKCIKVEGDCEDKHPPGKPSDCPLRVMLCDEAIYYDFMTDQCPETCGRCGQTAAKDYGNGR